MVGDGCGLRWLRASVLGGLIAGTIDIGSASLIYRASPAVIMRAIAGGVLGPRAIELGIAVSLLGLTLQWAMSVLIAMIYCLALPRLPTILRRSWVLAGCGYGVVVFVVMEYMVVPLSALHRWPHLTIAWLLENLFAMALFGCIVAYAASVMMRSGASQN